MKPALAAYSHVLGRTEQKRQAKLGTAVNDTEACILDTRTNTRDQCLDVRLLSVDYRVLRDPLTNCTVTRKKA